MLSDGNVQPALRQRALERLRRLAPEERDALLVACWMSHDARWFTAVAREYGMAVTNRLNRVAARELGRAEARRLARALGLSPAASLDDWLLTQETFIGLLGPDLLDYRVRGVSDTAYEVQVARCFAHDNAVRAGIAGEYECGIFERVAGWLEGSGLESRTSPPVGRCLKAQGRECAYTITLTRGDGHE